MMAKKPKVLDPSRTTTLRQQYMAEVRNRTKALKGAINKWLVEEDNLGLKPRSPSNIFKSNKVFEFSTDPDKLDGFKKWFQGQVDEGILGVDVPGPAWHSKYVDSSYRKGAARAYIDTHKEDLAPSADFFAGSKAQFLQQAFAAPETLSKIQLIYTRQFDRLKGFTDQMASETSRLLAEGLSNGLHPSTIARNMNKAIDKLTKTRALTIARTEVIHAHAEGQLDSFEALGVEEVGIKAEWVTAGDDRVCAQCAAMEGEVMTVKEARGLIPLHPNCRCAWIPATVEMKKAKPKVKAKPAPKPAPKPTGVAQSRDDLAVARKKAVDAKARRKALEEVTIPDLSDMTHAGDWRESYVKQVEEALGKHPLTAEVAKLEDLVTSTSRAYLDAEDDLGWLTSKSSIELRMKAQVATEKTGHASYKAKEALKKTKAQFKDEEREIMFSFLREKDNIASLAKTGTGAADEFLDISEELFSWVPKKNLSDVELRSLGGFDVGVTKVGTKGSGYYLNRDKYIQIVVRNVKKTAKRTVAEQRVFAHELGHHISHKVNGFMGKQNKFFTSRTTSESVKTLPKFSKETVGKKDRFKSLDEYAGRVYPDGTNPEIASIGIEHMWLNPLNVARKDPEWFDTIIGGLKKLDVGKSAGLGITDPSLIAAAKKAEDAAEKVVKAAAKKLEVAEKVESVRKEAVAAAKKAEAVRLAEVAKKAEVAAKKAEAVAIKAKEAAKKAQDKIDALKKPKSKPAPRDIGTTSSDPKLKGKPNFDDAQLHKTSSPEYKWLNAGDEPSTVFGVTGYSEVDVATRRLNAAKNLVRRSKLPKSEVLRLMDRWQNTSNGNDYTMLLMQERSAKKFGGKLSKWQQDRIGVVRKARKEAIGSIDEMTTWATTLEDVSKDGKYVLKANLPGGSVEDNLDIFLDTIYEATQESLKKAGIKTVRVWRGAQGQIDNKYEALIEAGKAVPIKGNAMESWSISRNIAADFVDSVDGALLSMEVPVERVISSSLTGIGTSSELEVVILQGIEDLVKMEIGL